MLKPSYRRERRRGGIRRVADALVESLETRRLLSAVTSPLGPSGEEIALQPDGKILVTTPDERLVRLHPDGSADTTFSGDGVIELGVLFSDINDVIMVDDKILVGGASNPAGAFQLARLNPDGSFDGTFGNGGSLRSYFAGNDAFIADLHLPGRSGQFMAGGGDNFAVYLGDGTLVFSKENQPIVVESMHTVNGADVPTIVIAGGGIMARYTWGSWNALPDTRFSPTGTKPIADGVSGVLSDGRVLVADYDGQDTELVTYDVDGVELDREWLYYFEPTDIAVEGKNYAIARTTLFHEYSYDANDDYAYHYHPTSIGYYANGVHGEAAFHEGGPPFDDGGSRSAGAAIAGGRVAVTGQTTPDEIPVVVDGLRNPQSPYPPAIPRPGQLIQAEFYDNGGEGIAYHDADAANNGGDLFREAEGVDIGNAGYANGLAVGWTTAGEWLEYTIHIPEAGKYTFDARVASAGQGGTFHAEVDRVDVTGAITVPNTGGFTTWQTLTSLRQFELPAGLHTLRVALDANGSGSVGNFDWFGLTEVVPPPPGQTAYGGVAPSAGSRVEAEAYDTGGAGVAYQDVDAINRGNAYRPGEGVDVGTIGGGFAVGWTKPGEWVEYTMNVPVAGTFKAELSAAQVSGGGIIDVTIDGQAVGSIEVPNTGSWTRFVTLATPGAIPLTAGDHVVRLAMRQAAGNGDVADVDWLRLAPTTQNPPTGQAPYNPVPWAPNETIQAENFDHGGEGISYHDVDAANRGNAYRPAEGVDTAAVNGGYAVGWTKAGEWLEYTVDVGASGGAFKLEAALAQVSTGGLIEVRVDGTLQGVIDVPNTGSWTRFVTAPTAAMNLSPGQHVIRLDLARVAGNGDVGDIDWLRLVPTTAQPPTGSQTPFLGVPFNTGQTIQAEDFDNGGENVAYHDLDALNRGGVYRTNQGVDIAAVNGGHAVGWTKPGEWLEYSLNVASAGNYRLDLSAAQVSSGGVIDVRIDGQLVGTITVSSTGSWVKFNSFSTGPFALTAGNHVLRLDLRQAAGSGDVADLDWLRVVPA